MTDSAFTVAEYRRRVASVQDAMAAADLDVLLAHSMASVCYLTGLESFAVHKYWLAAVPRSGDPILLVQGFESLNASIGCWITDVVTYDLQADHVTATAELLSDRGFDGGRLGIELGPLTSLTPHDYVRLGELLPRASFTDAAPLISSVRAIKSAAEIDYMRQAAALSSAGMQAAIDTVAAGKTDNDVAAAAYCTMIGGGSEYFCYQPIVTVGRRSGIPHSTFQRVEIKPGDAVFMEFGACIRRYSSPIMRTVFVGRPPDQVRRMVDACIASVDTLIEKIRPGIVAGDLARQAETQLASVIEKVIWHGSYCYSVGLGFPPTWADCPEINVTVGSEMVLQAGMVFHCSTSLRDPGRCGTTCSETVAVTETGCEVLTSLAREVIVL